MSRSAHVFLTGLPGVGKTTLVKKTADHLMKSGVSVSGFYTEELRANGQRIGFDVVTLDGKRSPLARSSTSVRGPMVGKYTIDVASFEGSVLPLLDWSGPQSETNILVVDEIGKMELFSDKFKRKMAVLLDGSNDLVIFGTIPSKRGKGIPFVESIRQTSNVKVFEITKENRNAIFNDIVAALGR